jgi:hypothetical protein
MIYLITVNGVQKEKSESRYQAMNQFWQATGNAQNGQIIRLMEKGKSESKCIYHAVKGK